MKPGSLIPLVLILGAFYLLILRPTRTRQRQQAALQRQLAPGARVMTTSGIFGTVEGIDDDAIRIEVSPGIVLRFARAAVGRVLPEESDDDGDEATDEHSIGSASASSDVDREPTSDGARGPAEPEGRSAG